jgi:protein arginine N-methyltransferase 3
MILSGTVVEGTFFCHKSPDNSRELDVEIHYTVVPPDQTSAPIAGERKTIIQTYKVR